MIVSDTSRILSISITMILLYVDKADIGRLRGLFNVSSLVNQIILSFLLFAHNNYLFCFGSHHNIIVNTSVYVFTCMHTYP